MKESSIGFAMVVSRCCVGVLEVSGAVAVAAAVVVAALVAVVAVEAAERRGPRAPAAGR